MNKMLRLSKLEVAEYQLDRALRLFLDENDYVCSITLAGAVEEILGKLLKNEGKENALSSFVNSCVGTGKAVYNEDWPSKDFVEMANSFRNDLKHYTDGEAITIPRGAAVEILDRAVENYFALTGCKTANMQRFMESEHGF